MGCMSFWCSECEQPLNSNSFSGEHCILFLVEAGEVLEWMQGEYDSYGRVFTKSSAPDQRPQEGAWSPETPAIGENPSQLWESRDWSGVCDLMFSGDSGIAAYHSGCFRGNEFIEVSDHDPNQGWGEYKYPVDGSFDHGVATRVKPRWAKAEGSENE